MPDKTSSLYITKVNATNPLLSVKAIREAARLLDNTDASLKNCRRMHDLVLERGWAFAGEGDEALVVQIQAALEENGIESAIDLNTALIPEPGEQPEAIPLVTAADTTVEDTGMALVAIMGGNPLNAGANCYALARTTGDREFWEKVQAALLRVFPYIEPLLEKEGVKL